MAKNKTWTTEVNGQLYTINFRYSHFGVHRLEVNGFPVPVERKSMQAFTGLDQPFYLGTKMARLVLIGSKADIAVDNIYLGSGKPYMPLHSIPWWAWVSISLCILIPVLSMGGAVPVLIGGLGSICCMRISVSPVLKTVHKVLACYGIALLAWLVLVLFVYIMTFLVPAAI